MALSRKFMQGMGLTEEQASAIIEANEETISGLKGEIEKYKSASETSEKKLAKVQKELDEAKELAEQNEGKNPYKLKYDELKKEFETFKADAQKNATKAAKESAYKNLLREAGILEKHLDKVLKVSNLDGIELDEDGKIKDVDALKKSIAEEWDDFIPKNGGQQGAGTSTPPANNGGKKTKEEILAIKDTAERQQAMYDNKDLFLT